jgi:dipeptidyl aminopeptidase/acylaminoacyl peptidase
MKLNIKLISILLGFGFLISSAVAQQNVMPQSVSTTNPIIVNKPIIMDSVGLNDKKFSNLNLLESYIAFPKHNKFTQSITPDNGFFRLTKPANGFTIQLLSFFISADQFSNAKLKVTSPNLLEVYVDGEKKATKSETQDSLSSAKGVDAALSGNLRNTRVIIKILSSADDKIAPALKIELMSDKGTDKVNYSFHNNEQRRMSIVDVLDGKRVNSSSISPGGTFILLSFTETLPGGERKNYTEVFDVKRRRTVLSESTNRDQLSWMPKSDLLYYVTDNEEGRTILTLDPLKMETKILASKLPKENFYFSPDEKSIFYTSKESLNVKNPNGLKRLLSPEDRQPNYRDRWFIYQYIFDSGLAQQLTFGRNSTFINDVSNDGENVLFSTSNEDYSERPFKKTSLFLLHLPTMKIDTLFKDETYAYFGQFSPDGKKVLIAGAPEAFNGIGLNIKEGQIANSYDVQSFIMDINTKKVDPVTKYFNPSIDSQSWNDFDTNIYYQVQERDRENVYRYSPSSKKFIKLPLKEDVIRNFSVANNSSWATYTGVSISNSNRTYLLDLKNMESILIADPYADRLNSFTLGEVKDWSFVSQFGDTIDGRYYLPPNFDPTKKYPLIVYYYGGTSPTQRIFESTYPLHVYAAQDFVVYTLQPSGTTGYGQEFSARHVNAWGIQTAEEIVEGTKKFVNEHSFIDSTKIGNIGASYGGFMTQYLIAYTDLFKAAVSHAGISNIASYWGEGYWGYTYSAGASAGSYPWNNPELYIKQSPLFNADKIKTPLLLLHGTADTNVPIGESIQMYTALKLLGKPVEFIQVEGENHAIYDYKKRIEWNNAIYSWFTKWLKNESGWWNSMYPDK